MLFIEINGEKYPCKIHSFTTQLGQNALRVISSEAPLAENGFSIIDENDEIIADRSDYTFLYREDDKCKEYTAQPETIISPEFSYTGIQPESPYSILSREISAVASQVSAITPYEESMDAYVGDTECVFNISIQGDISAFVVDRDGNSIPNTVTREDDKIRVAFEALDQVATVTISIQ